MRTLGNSNPELCALNLLKIKRGEVPFDRIKGVDFSVIDLPIEQAKAEIIEDSRWLINTYEPRVNINQLTVSEDKYTLVSITADLTLKGVRL